MSPSPPNVRSLMAHLFAIFFLSKPLPHTKLIVCRLEKELSQVKSHAVKQQLLEYLSEIFAYLRLMDHVLIPLSKHSINGSWLNFEIKIAKPYYNDLQTVFFTRLCKDFVNRRHKCYSSTFLREKSMELVLFNGLKEKDVKERMDCFEAINDWIRETLITLYTHSIDQKGCSCHTYKMSGDCSCLDDDCTGFDEAEEEDDEDDYDIHTDCDAFKCEDDQLQGQGVVSSYGRDETD